MLRAFTDTLLRIGSALGLVLLLAAHENACAWLEPPPAKADPAKSADDSEKPSAPRATVDSCLPDIASGLRRPAPSESGIILPFERRASVAAERGLGAAQHNYHQQVAPAALRIAAPRWSLANRLGALSLQRPLQVRASAGCDVAIGSAIAPHAPPRHDGLRFARR